MRKDVNDSFQRFGLFFLRDFWLLLLALVLVISYYCHRP